MTPSLARRLPFFYGWLVVAVVFVTMALGVNARTAFSLLMPPVLAEFGWDRGVTAGAFSFGFLVSAVLSPTLGRLMDRRGPRTVMLLGVAVTGAGLLLATLTTQPWHLYATLGVLVGAGSVALGYTGQTLFLPNWFARRRGLATGIAFAGVGAGSIVMMPWFQGVIETAGWRAACWTLGIVVVLVAGPLNLLLRRRPEDLGLTPDGDPESAVTTASGVKKNVVDQAWAATEWTLARALRTARFWWVGIGYFGALFAWYAVQVHQTKYLVEVGFSASQAAWALGAVSLVGIPGQIALGHLSDRMGREIVWAISCIGFVLTYLLLLALAGTPSLPLLYLMVGVQGVLGYGMTSVVGAIPAEIFEGKHYGSIFGTLMLGAIAGGAAGPWALGALYDATGNYVAGFWLSLAFAVLSMLAIWRASPGKVRAVAGRVR
ncbi:MAG TPA: MFS transporter [Quisquiliibacterium sp.]|nr:MFS transporter [Quisquiliibacterium sp.]